MRTEIEQEMRMVVHLATLQREQQKKKHLEQKKLNWSQTEWFSKISS